MATPTSLSPSAVVSALRAAGCVFAEDEAELILATARTPQEAAGTVDRRTAGPARTGPRLGRVPRTARHRGTRGVRAPPPYRVPGRPGAGRRTRTRPWSSTCAAVPARSARPLAAALDDAEVHAADIDPAAVPLRPPQSRRLLRPGPRGRPVRRAARRPARPGGHPDGQRALPCPPPKWPCCRRRPATTTPLVALDGGPDGLGRCCRGGRRGARVARPRRLSADRDRRTPGTGRRTDLPRRGPDGPSGGGTTTCTRMW